MLLIVALCSSLFVMQSLLYTYNSEVLNKILLHIILFSYAYAIEIWGADNSRMNYIQ